CASKGLAPQYRRLCEQEPFLSALEGAGFEHHSQLPRGALLGTVRLDGCVSTDVCKPGAEVEEVRSGGVWHITDAELAFGDFRAGRYGFLLSGPTPLVVPFPVRGSLSFFTVEVPDDLLNR